MARILICHVPKDGSVARDIGAALMGRGHFVSFDGEPDSPRPERASRLRQFEAVIVVWTEMSAQNPGLAEIASTTLPLNALVPVKADELETARLPLVFRKLNMFAPRDTDGIARMVGRLSTAASSLRDIAEREASKAASRRSAPAPASTPRPPPLPARGTQPQPIVDPAAAVRVRPLAGLPEVLPDPSLFPASAPRTSPPRQAFASELSAALQRHEAQLVDEGMHQEGRPAATVLSADDLARAVEAGVLAYHLPGAMWLAEPATVEIAFEREALAALVGPGQCQSIETVSISLYGHAEAFEIERQSERTQFVGAGRAASAGRDPATLGRWAWLVTPHAAGSQDLVVRVSALLRDRHGVPVPVALPDRRFAVDIQVPDDQGLVSALAGWRRR